MKEKIIGITGPTGSGKGVVSEILAEKLGCRVIDADSLVRDMYSSPGCLCEAVRECFGNEVMREDGTVDRERLSAVAFSSSDNLEKLNKSVLPIISREVLGIMHESKKPIILDAPTLFESGLDKYCDIVIGVIAHRDSRLKRILSRDNIAYAKGKNRIDSQKSDEFYIERCDKIILNDGSFEQVREKVQKLIEERGLV